MALAPALRRLPALEGLYLGYNPFGDEGLAALVAPPPTTTEGLAKLKTLVLNHTQITDAGCATLATALRNGALPALEKLIWHAIPASAEAKSTVFAARPGLKEEY